MVMLLNSQETDFTSKLDKILHIVRDTGHDVSNVVRDIIQDVRANGDDALLRYTQKFDDPNASLSMLAIAPEELDKASQHLDPDVKAALEFALKRIHAFHARQKPKHDYFEDDTGTYLGYRWTPVDAAGVYIPGGAASYPSSVLMNIAPAKVAGVERIVAVVPAPQGKVDPSVLYALKIAGADEIYKIGGAQAIAALAYGTDMIKRVDKITGPGNAFVAEAKRQVYGQAGIDSIAGPSEILVIADETANPEFLAADLLSQAEHDPVAQSVLICTSDAIIEQVLEKIDQILETLPRKDIAKASWDNYGVVIKADSLEEAGAISDKFAPEHLEICTNNPEIMLQHIRHAGAIFMGHYTPEAIGDYVAGPNHVLPTDRTARFSSGLGTQDFMKRTTMIHCSKESFEKIGPAAVTLAKAEGLQAHGLSVSLRLK